MNLRDRLDWAYGLAAGKRQAEEEAASELPEWPWGEVVNTAVGTCVQVREEFSLDHCHGHVALRELLERNPRSLGALDRSGSREFAHADELLFLDTETTGLAGGSGTVAFLVGVGFFRGDTFVVEQFFARDFDEEVAVLHLARQRLRQYPVWVTYNGKTYDVPLLNQRFVFHRLERELFPELHIDLLYPIRRFWKSRLGECSLSRSESQILRVQRGSDVPSYLVPSIYFRYLRNRDPWPLRPVFDHNVQDILSLVGLLSVSARVIEQPEHFQGGVDVLQAGRLLADRGRKFEAIRALEKSMGAITTPHEKKRVMLQLGRLLKSLGRREKAVRLWWQALDLPGFSTEPYVELAKYYEHQIRDYGRAEELTRRALESLRLMQTLGSRINDEEERQLLHRLGRLLRKQGKMTAREWQAGR